MESGLEQVAKQVLSKPKVKGYMCIDESGLCLYTEGINESSSGLFSSIAELSKQLDASDNEPIITLETEKRKILLKPTGSITAAVLKSK